MAKQTKPPLVSIILPTYDRAHIISRAIESVIKQTYNNWELIIVNDGSADKTENKIKEYLKKYKKIKYFYQKHSGHVQAMNYGLTKARGKIITFLNSDDYYKPTHLAKYLKYLQTHPQLAAVYGLTTIFGGRLIVDVLNKKNLIHIDKCIPEGTLFLRKNIIKKFSFSSQHKLAEGFWLIKRLKQQGYRLTRLPYRTYVYDRRQLDSLTKKYYGKLR